MIIITKTTYSSAYIGYIGQRHEQTLIIPYLTNITSILQIRGLGPNIVTMIGEEHYCNVEFEGNNLTLNLKRKQTIADPSYCNKIRVEVKTKNDCNCIYEEVPDETYLRKFTYMPLMRQMMENMQV